MKTLKVLLSLLLIFVSILTIQTVFPTSDHLVYGLLIFTAPGGVATPFAFNMTYLPEFLTYNHGGNQLTSLRVETQEDGVLHDWTAAGLNAMTGFMKVGAVTANDINLRLADGEIRPKNVTVSGVTSAAGAIGIYVASDNQGVVAFKSSNAAILALNPTMFEKFTALFIPTLATLTDYAEITYQDGHVQRWELEDIRRATSAFQQVEGVIINNVNGYIKKAIVRCAAATPCYIMSVDLKNVA
jgi:hypothetical protein